MNALDYAAQHDDLQLLEFWMRTNPPIFELKTLDRIITVTCSHNSTKCFEWALERIIQVYLERKLTFLTKPFDSAAKAGATKIFGMLVEKSIKMKNTKYPVQMGPHNGTLALAIANGNPTIVNALLKMNSIYSNRSLGITKCALMAVFKRSDLRLLKRLHSKVPLLFKSFLEDNINLGFIRTMRIYNWACNIDSIKETVDAAHRARWMNFHYVLLHNIKKGAPQDWCIKQVQLHLLLESLFKCHCTECEAQKKEGSPCIDLIVRKLFKERERNSVSSLKAIKYLMANYTNQYKFNLVMDSSYVTQLEIFELLGITLSHQMKQIMQAIVAKSIGKYCRPIFYSFGHIL